MIVIKIDGGLGNQMFQYALGEAFASQGKKVKYDTFGVNADAHNGFELTKVFRCIDDFFEASDEDCINLGAKRVGRIRRLIRKYYHSPQYIEYSSPKFSIKYIPNLFEYNDAYIVGYWQSYKYFDGIRNQIKDKFKFNNKEMSGECEQIYWLIKNDANSVSIHIRRGDYVGNKLYDGICDYIYYIRAIEYIKTIYPNSNFYVFSNDLKWCNEYLLQNVDRDKFKFVSCNTGENSYRDLQLMSLCKRNIIANSSFSWWGAWLNDNENKIVITPQKWFNGYNDTLDDLIPNGWVKL